MILYHYKFQSGSELIIWVLAIMKHASSRRDADRWIEIPTLLLLARMGPIEDALEDV